jgi:antitoxin ParD1/3/4
MNSQKPALQRIVVLKKAIKSGIESGLTKNFNADKHLEKLKSAKQKKG